MSLHIGEKVHLLRCMCRPPVCAGGGLYIGIPNVSDSARYKYSFTFCPTGHITRFNDTLTRFVDFFKIKCDVLRDCPKNTFFTPYLVS
jgi:hypothetical protein